MCYSRIRKVRRLGTAALTSLLMLCTQAALAVDDVHDVVWSFGDENIPSNGKEVTVTFDVFVTDTDLDGLAFSIQELHSSQTLVTFNYPDLGTVPTPGVPMTIYYSFRVRCDEQGNISATSTQVYVVYCDPNMPLEPLYDWGISEPWSAWVPGDGSFSLAVADEFGVPHTANTRTLRCADSTNDIETNLATTLKAQRQEELDHIARDGDSGTIGIYFDEAGTQCSGEILPGVPTNVYVVARQAGISDCGIHGGEFRFTGVPESWSVFPVAREDMLTIGNPFTNGVSFAMTSCQQPDNGAVVIYSVLVLATAFESDVEFRIQPSNPPSNRSRNCQLLHICDNPFFGAICVDGVSCHVNPSVPKACTVAVSVEDRTWGSVKQIFRD